MTTLIKNTATTSTAIIKGYDSDNGGFATILDTLRFIDDTTLVFEGNNYTITPAMQQACTIQRFYKEKGNAQASIDYAVAGYYGRNHYHCVNGDSKKKNPIERVGKVLTSLEYGQNCVSLNSKTLDKISLYDALMVVDGLALSSKDKELVKAVANLKSLFLTSENVKNRDIIANNEQVDLKLFKALSSAGFLSLSRNTDDSFNASIAGENLATMPSILATNKLELLNSVFNASTMQIDITFTAINTSE